MFHSPTPIWSVAEALKRFMLLTYANSFCFRGQSDASWPLLPRAGREPFATHWPAYFSDSDTLPPDLAAFEKWRLLAHGYCETLPSNNLECLAYAQHYGLPTRLLDFSESPLVALYFATCENYDKDGAVFAYHPNLAVDYKAKLPLEKINRVACLIPPPFDQRLLNQRARFVYFPDPKAPLKEPENFTPEHQSGYEVPSGLVKFTIDAECKHLIQKDLRGIGISRRSFFTDLDGLSLDFVEEVMMQRRLREMDEILAKRKESEARQLR